MIFTSIPCASLLLMLQYTLCCFINNALTLTYTNLPLTFRRRKAAAASAMVVAGGSGRRPHTYETAVHKVPPPPPHGNPYAVPRYGPYGPVDPGGGGGGGVLSDENVYCEIPADHVPEPSPHMYRYHHACYQALSY